LTKEEWLEVAKLVRPDWSEGDFESAWDEFQEYKAGVIAWRELKVRYRANRELGR
jgi:hypothetical protein